MFLWNEKLFPVISHSMYLTELNILYMMDASDNNQTSPICLFTLFTISIHKLSGINPLQSNRIDRWTAQPLLYFSWRRVCGINHPSYASGQTSQDVTAVCRLRCSSGRVRGPFTVSPQTEKPVTSSPPFTKRSKNFSQFFMASLRCIY